MTGCGVVQDTVVGVVALTADVDLPRVAKDYALSAVLDPPKYLPGSYATLTMCVVNPIFSPQGRDILAAALALLRRPVALAAPASAAAAFPAGGPLLDVPAAAGAAAAPLLAVAPPLTHRRKAALNVRVVVVGASETGLAALRSIALRRDAALPHVTLLAPLGADAAPALLDPQLGAVLHDPCVTVINASMVSLDRCRACLSLPLQPCTPTELNKSFSHMPTWPRQTWAGCASMTVANASKHQWSPALHGTPCARLVISQHCLAPLHPEAVTACVNGTPSSAHD